MSSFEDLTSLSDAIVRCKRCTRLRRYCAEIAKAKRRSYQDESYWAKPVAGFGTADAQLVVVGLAPGAHGANRTGRVFTGDASGLWLYRALHRAGFANQAKSTHRGDGLMLLNSYVTCAVRCAPPDNRPTPQETQTCTNFLAQEIQLLTQARVYVALGQFALLALWRILSPSQPRPVFAHGAHWELASGRTLLASYHPSQQNTSTRRLTESMLDSIFDDARRRIAGRNL